MSDKPKIQPSPMRIVRAWLFRERAVRGPAAIELDVVERQVDRETAAVCTARDDAAGIERLLQNVRNAVQAAITDRETPGVIDSAETRKIARQLIGTTIAAHHHKQQLDSLT